MDVEQLVHLRDAVVAVGSHTQSVEGIFPCVAQPAHQERRVQQRVRRALGFFFLLYCAHSPSNQLQQTESGLSHEAIVAIVADTQQEMMAQFHKMAEVCGGNHTQNTFTH
jgi:hypothetical protein